MKLATILFRFFFVRSYLAHRKQGEDDRLAAFSAGVTAAFVVTVTFAALTKGALRASGGWGSAENVAQIIGFRGGAMSMIFAMSFLLGIAAAYSFAVRRQQLRSEIDGSGSLAPVLSLQFVYSFGMFLIFIYAEAWALLLSLLGFLLATIAVKFLLSSGASVR